MNLIKIMAKRFVSGFRFGDGLWQKTKAAFGMVFASLIGHLSFVMKYNGHRAIVNFGSGSDVATWIEVFADEEYRLPENVSPKRILDLGANVGFASLYFNMCYPDSEIAALEPDPQNMRILKKISREFPELKYFPWRPVILPADESYLPRQVFVKKQIFDLFN